MIEYVEPSRLKANPLNAKYFKEVTLEELQNLVENIRVNGIHTPLIARSDYTLIAGHNRLEAARELGLEFIPVQFLQEDISERDEIMFIIADNLLRRHLSNSEKIELYRIMFPNFDERVKVRPNTNGVDSVHTLDAEPLTAADIAKETGQTKVAVQKQLQRFEQQSRRESQENRRTQEEVAVMSASKSEEMMRAREREADRALRSAVEEISLQLQRTDVSDDWRRTAMQRVLRTVEKQQKLLPA